MRPAPKLRPHVRWAAGRLPLPSLPATLSGEQLPEGRGHRTSPPASSWHSSDAAGRTGGKDQATQRHPGGGRAGERASDLYGNEGTAWVSGGFASPSPCNLKLPSGLSLQAWDRRKPKKNAHQPSGGGGQRCWEGGTAEKRGAWRGSASPGSRGFPDPF